MDSITFYGWLGVIVVCLVVIIDLLVKQSKHPSLVGKDEILGAEGEARTELNPKGMIFVNGELWQAKSLSGEIKKGQAVKVTAVHKLTLEVEKIIEEV